MIRSLKLLMSSMSLLLTCSCAPEEPAQAEPQVSDGAAQVPTSPGEGESVSLERQRPDQLHFSVGAHGGAQTRELSVELTQLMGDAVTFASSSAGTGQLVTTGTITQQGQRFSYSPSPTDRLTVRLTDGTVIDLFIAQLSGDLSSLDDFLSGDHVLQYRVQSGMTNLSVGSQRSGRERAQTVSGYMELHGLVYQLQVQLQEQVVAEVEQGYSSRESEEQISGVISSADGLRVELNERYRYVLLVSDNAVENVTKTSSNRWVMGGQQYALSDAMIRYETYDGWPNPTDYWVARGQLTRDGAVIGQIGMEQKPLWVEVFLQMVDGERLEIDRHILRQ